MIRIPVMELVFSPVEHVRVGPLDQVLVPENDALPLEYKLMYGGAYGDLDLADVVNQPAAACEVRVFRGGLVEEAVDLSGIGEARSISDY